MLSKEKIANKADMYADYHWPATIYAGEELKKQFCNQNFTAGATWASEQYSGVIKALEELVIIAENASACARETWQKAKEELNKLKQP